MKPYELFYQPGDQRYSLQSNDGNYYKQNGLVNEHLFSQHLQGTITLGAFTTYQNTCLFGAWDIDINKSIYSKYEDTEQAFNHHKEKIENILSQFEEELKDYPHYIEFSGRKGAHVWIFFNKPMPSNDVYDYLQDIEKKIDFPRHLFHIETFPKQAQTYGDGNLIKVPLATHLVSGRQAYWCDTHFNKIDLPWEGIKRLSKEDFDKMQRSVYTDTKKKKRKKKTVPLFQNKTTFVPEFIEYTEEGLERLKKRCVALKNAQTEGTTQSNNWHIFVGAVYGRLNRPDLVHETLSNNAFDYDPPRTDYHLSKLI